MTSHRFALVMALTLAAAPVVHAGPLGPTKPSQLVTVLSGPLTCNAGAGRSLTFQAAGDGSFVNVQIPEGSVLVVTDWDWCENSNPSAAFVSLAIEGPGGIASVSNVFRDSLMPACSHGDLGAGVKVSSGSQLCATPVGANAFIKAHGYLTKDR